MPTDTQNDPRNLFVPRRLPWLLGVGMLLVYGLTLNHWVNLQNISQVATVSGWIWWPQVQNPLLYLLTLPFRLLPPAHIPLALNLLSTLFAASTVAILARSVAILPHDRTEMERLRERSEFSFLSSWVAWVPPAAAVVFAGFQLTFWKSATSFNGESFELLWFAIILWQLLEYRLDEKEGRLYLAAALFGMGVIENWGLIGYIPIFLMMLIWLRGLSFFHLHFLLRLSGAGSAGILCLLLLVVPLMARYSGASPEGIFDAIKFLLRSDWQVARMASVSEVRHNLALLSLTSLLPAFFMALRWSATFGDSSRMGATFVNYMMHGFNAVIMGLLLWRFFDPPFSGHDLAAGLTFSYVSALCLGYYCGYFLLIFGQEPIRTRRTANPEPALPKSLLWLCPIIVLVVLAALGLGAGLLVYRNTPVVRANNGDVLLKFAEATAQNLPRTGAVVLCDRDDAGPPVRVYLMQAELARTGHTQQFPVIDTHFLDWPQYHKYLHARYPDTWPANITTNYNQLLSPFQILALLHHVSTNHALCYINPSFGYFFDYFYPEPHGLVDVLKPLPEDTLLPPEPGESLLAENQTFWQRVLDENQPAITAALHPRKMPAPIARVMQRLHVPAETDPNAILAGTFYSRGLNTLGVHWQRANALAPAAECFRNAIALNSNNVVASINLAFNETLRAGTATDVNVSRTLTDQFGKYHDWNDVMSANGPFDESSFCFAYGLWLMQQASPPLWMPALAQFHRVSQLVAGNLNARLSTAHIYLLNQRPQLALEALREPLAQPARFALTETNSTELSFLAAKAYFLANQNAAAAALLDAEIDHHPENQQLMFSAALALGNYGLYSNALRVVNRQLALHPTEPAWLYCKGLNSLNLGAYDDAIAALSQFLDVQTNNLEARFDRALAYFKTDRLEAASTDLHQVQASQPNNFQTAFALGEIAWRQHQTNEAVRNYKIFLTTAPPNAQELGSVRERLNHLATP